MHAVETLFSVPPARSIHPLCRCNASRTVLKHTASHSSTSMLREAPNGLPAGEVSSFGRHTLNTPPASKPQHPQSAPRPHPLERHPPPPRWSLHLTSRGGRDRKVSTTSRRLAGEIHDDASSSGGRPSGPRVRPDAPSTASRQAAASGAMRPLRATTSRDDLLGSGHGARYPMWFCEIVRDCMYRMGTSCAVVPKAKR